MSRILAAALLAAGPAAAAPQIEIEAGPALRTEVHALAHVDWHDRPAAPADTDVRRARLGVSGAIFTRVEYEVEHDFSYDDRPWRDAYLNVRLGRAFEVRGGRFKVPFGLDQLTGAAELDFLSRAAATGALAPGREVGLMVHGRLFARRLRYQIGVFRSGGDNISADERRDPRHGPLVAGRFVYRPWSERARLRGLRGLAVGAAATTDRVPDGDYSLRGDSALDVPFFPAIAVSGRRFRLSGEIDWRAGPVGLGGEVLRVIDERLGQSTDDGALPDVVAQGWYVRATWLVTGDRKTDQVRPSRPLLQGGVGAVELAARLEDLALASRGAFDVPTRSTRGERVVPTGDRAVTLGVNWYLNRFLKVQAHVIRDWRRENGARLGGARTWSPMVRAQVAL